MSDHEKLDCILDYLEAFNDDLWHEAVNSNEVTRPIIDAKISVIDKIIDDVERLTGEKVIL